MEVVLLRDEDRSTIMDGTWKRINTLRHYGVRDGAILCVVPRKEHAPPGRSESNVSVASYTFMYAMLHNALL